MSFKYHQLDLNRFINLKEADIAYCLGVIATDGCLTFKGRAEYLSFGFQYRDRVWLKKILKILKVNNKINIRTYNNKKYVFVSISKQGIIKTLSKYNITPTKSLTIKYANNIPQQLQRHFIRGIIDGDGSVIHTYQKNKYNQGVKIVSCSRYFILGIQKQLKSENIGSTVRVEIRKKSKRADLYTLAISSKDLIKLYDYLYKNSSICLLRKKKKFIQIVNHRKKIIKFGVSGKRRQELVKRFTKSYLSNLFFNRKLSIPQIAKKESVDKSCMYNHFKRLNIKY